MSQQCIKPSLPEAFDTRSGSDTDKFIQALCKVIGSANEELQDVLADRFVVTADGAGLNRLGEGYGIERPPNLSDAGYQVLIQTKLPAKRGTLQAIRSVFEAAYGSKLKSIEDKQLNPSIEGFFICITVEDFSFGRAGFCDVQQVPDGESVAGINSVWSAQEGPTLANSAQALEQGRFNDYYWHPVDTWTMRITNCVKLAGTFIVYKPCEENLVTIYPCYPPLTVMTPVILHRAQIAQKTLIGDTQEGDLLLTLPDTAEMGEGDTGCDFFFVRDGPSNLDITPNAGQSLLGGGGSPLQLTSDRESVTLRYFHNSGSPIWQVIF